MIWLTLDTSCFDKQSAGLIDELNNLQKEGLIEIWHEGYSVTEKENWESPDKAAILSQMYTATKCKHDAFAVPEDIIKNPEKLRKYIEQKQGYTYKELHRVHSIIDEIVYPEIVRSDQNESSNNKILNKYIDNKILALHVVRKRDIFVTKDKVLFRQDKKYEKIEARFSIKVRLLDKIFISELKELLRK